MISSKILLSLLPLFALTSPAFSVETLINNIEETITLQEGNKYHVSTEALNVRTSNSTTASNVVGKIYLNDAVEVVEVSRDSSLVAVKISKSSSFKPKNPNQIYYISKKFLSPQDVLGKQSPYFVIQNIATEKTRVYKRCDSSPGCPHQLIFEADMVAGRPEEGNGKNHNAYKTYLGHGRISEWIKFYQDSAAQYPHWYREGQNLDTIPPRAPRNSDGTPKPSILWAREWQKEYKGNNTIYGAFGWYAAKLYPATGPNSINFQWMHGTFGWGSDGEAAIDLTRSTLLNLFANPGSSGCTRLSNGSIAYLRSILPAGTDVYRVYAREATREAPCLKKSFFTGKCTKPNIFPRYRSQVDPKPWNYVMLTDDAQQSGGVSADPSDFLRLNITVREGQNVIERGTYYVDQYPDPAGADYNWEASSGKTADRYEIDDPHGGHITNFRGHFLVDEGRFIDYQHPKHSNIVIGGMVGFQKSVPAHLRTSGNFVPAEIKFRTRTNNGY